MTFSWTYEGALEHIKEHIKELRMDKEERLRYFSRVRRKTTDKRLLRFMEGYLEPEVEEILTEKVMEKGIANIIGIYKFHMEEAMISEIKKEMKGGNAKKILQDPEYAIAFKNYYIDKRIASVFHSKKAWKKLKDFTVDELHEDFKEKDILYNIECQLGTLTKCECTNKTYFQYCHMRENWDTDIYSCRNTNKKYGIHDLLKLQDK